MNAPLSADALKQDKLRQLLSDLENRVVVNGPGDIALGARNIYTDPTLFELELEHLIEGGWVYAAHESQLPNPNDYFTINVGRQPVVLTRDAEGKVHGFLNVCAHRGAKVVRHTKGNQKVHLCMFHGWCYNSKGELINVTDEADGGYPPGFDRKHLGLTPVAKLESYRGFIWVSLNPDVPPLKEYLNGSTTFIDLLVDQSPTGELEVLPGETTYIYQGNWKLQAENGLDGYHVKATHGNYLMTVGRRAKGQSTTETKTYDISKLDKGASGFYAFDQGHAVLYAVYPNYQDRPNFEFRDSYFEKYGVARAVWMTERLRNLMLMPNVFLMDQMSTQIRVFRPLAVDRTEVITYCVAPKGESAKARENRLRQYEDFFNASGMATPDDLAEFRNCQIGFQAKAAPFSDISRGQTRWERGVNAVGQEIGVEARMSSTQVADEGIYVSILEEWARRMQDIVQKELERSGQ
ncbi:aromatic ring-hydroxylating oxygenase subunit alpha [Rugosibacter aromaticivorans]|uniref:aromatic ring-hydroxylating oxygenase subunit alpha n=1 Tax=Rugosibacter aromaticivorans TaxID=1565605 RepID=UPI000AE44699|nr:aromatic ring-hydroxylating dioxygenase subunit alpha [Rugosibacter aromaticivorans]